MPLPNLNEVAFPRVTTDRVRLLATPQDGFGVGVKEIQVFNTGIDVEPITAPQVFASASPASGFAPLTVQFTGFAEDPQGDELTIEWDFGDGATSNELSPEHTYTEPGSYTATLTATDGDGETGTASVDIEAALFDGNVAVFATATCSVTSPWETCQGINTGVDPTTSNPGVGVGWGTWPNGGTQWMQLDWDEPDHNRPDRGVLVPGLPGRQQQWREAPGHVDPAVLGRRRPGLGRREQPERVRHRAQPVQRDDA